MTEGDAVIGLGTDAAPVRHEGRPAYGWLPVACRLTGHAGVWSAVLVPMVAMASSGWMATGDNAAISIRAWQALSLHPPLVGMLSTAGSGAGHPLFDPGPLLFWLLAVPVHLDPRQGALWGAAVVGGVALSAAVEAVWSTGRWFGCAIVGLVTLDLLWQVPNTMANLVWNAYFPVPFFVASVALAWVVGTGRLGWWPVLVLTTSVAAQSHLTYLMVSVSLAVIAPVVGVVAAGRPTRWRWLSAGLGVGLLCWFAPLLQNLGRHGNLAVLVHTDSGQSVLGAGFGLSVVGTASSPSPIWLARAPTGYFSTFGFIYSNAAWTGAAVLIVLASVAALAWWRQYRPLAVLALVAFLCSASMAFSFALFPKKNGLNVIYLVTPLWVIGAVVWSVVVWAAVLAVRAAATRLPAVRRRWDDAVDALGGRLRLVSTATVAVVGVVIALGFIALIPLAAFTPEQHVVGWSRASGALIDEAALAIEHAVPRGPVVYRIDSPTIDVYDSLWLTEGVAWRLEQDGWQPGLYAFERSFTGLVPHRFTPAVKVSLDRSGVTAVKRSFCSDAVVRCHIP